MTPCVAIPIFRACVINRDAAGHPHRPGDAEKRVGRLFQSGHPGPAACSFPGIRSGRSGSSLPGRISVYSVPRSTSLGVAFDHTARPLDAWVTLMLMEVWHWTPLVALLAYAGLRAIPEVYYQAAKIDGASPWATFYYIQLPKMRGVLTIALLLRFMDSFLIYAEPFVLTGGGPGNATTFLSIYLVKLALGQFDLGPAAAFSLIYFLIVLLLSFMFYQVLQRRRKRREGMKGKKKTIALAIYFVLLFLPIYWMINMSLRTNADILGVLSPVSDRSDL